MGATGDATALVPHLAGTPGCRHDDVLAWKQTHPASPGLLAVGVEVESAPTSTVAAVHTPFQCHADAKPMAACMIDQGSRATASFVQPVFEVEECCVRIETRHQKN